MKAKKSRRDREREWREDSVPRGAGVDYSKVADRHIDDKRYERQKQGTASAAAASGPSLVLDTLVRMQAGLEGRTVAQKIADPNRPTWEQYKKANEDKLDIAGAELKKMAAYRKELDAEREARLQARREVKHQVVSSEDEDGDEDDSDGGSSARKKRKKKDKKRKDKKDKKKSKKHRKHRSRSRSRSRSRDRRSRSRSRSTSNTRDRSRSRDRRDSSGSGSDAESSRNARHHREDEETKQQQLT